MKVTKTQIALWAPGTAIMLLMGWFVFLPIAQAGIPQTYTGVVTYKSPIQSFGIGIGAQNNIYLTIGNHTVICQLLSMDEQQQTDILTLHMGQNTSLTIYGQGICDAK